MHINLARRKPSFSSIKIIYLYLSHTCLEGHPWLFKRALPFTFLQCPLTFVSFKRPAFCSRSETYQVSMSFSHLFLMPLLFLQSPLCPQGEKTRLLKENKTRRKVADVHFFYPGGRVGEDSWEAWEEGVQYCRVETFPKVFGTPTEELAVDRPSFCLKYGPLFSIFNWLYDVKMLFLSHVIKSCCVSLSWVCVSVLSAPALLKPCMVWMGVGGRVCIHLPSS